MVKKTETMSHWAKPLLKKSENKYGAKKITAHGYSFASKGEAACYEMILAEARAGMIDKEIQVQDHVYLTDARILYIADFKIKRDEEFEWIEFKGFETDVWRIKRRLWIHYGPGRLRIYKQKAGRLILDEIIDP